MIWHDEYTYTGSYEKRPYKPRIGAFCTSQTCAGFDNTVGRKMNVSKYAVECPRCCSVLVWRNLDEMRQDSKNEGLI